MVHTLLVCNHCVVTWDWPGTILSTWYNPFNLVQNWPIGHNKFTSNIVLCQVDDDLHLNEVNKLTNDNWGYWYSTSL